MNKEIFIKHMDKALKAKGMLKPDRTRLIDCRWREVEKTGLCPDTIIDAEEQKARKMAEPKKVEPKNIDYSSFSTFVGIDPGKQTGFARYVNGKVDSIFTVDFWYAIDLIHLSSETVTHFVIEVPHSKNVWHKGAKDRGAIERTGVNVGMAIREAELIAEYLEKNGYSHETRHPQGKLTSSQFKAITGYEGRTNQHERDAAMLIYHLSKTGDKK